MTGATPLFGTDGIRAVANRGPLVPARVVRLGQVLGRWLRERRGARARVLVARDPRKSGPMLEGALVSGLASRGVSCGLAGVLPTPACAALVPKLGYDLGIVLSASHNPMRDNGVKVFAADGAKLSEADEREIEEKLRKGGHRGPSPVGARVGTAAPEPAARETYLRDLVAAGAAAGAALHGMKIVLDCAHGATGVTAPDVLRRLGAQVIPLAVEPDPERINRRVGALYPARMAEKTRRGKAVLGLALDGDGDRVVAADERGVVRDGDAILLVLARDLRKRGALPGSTVVGTSMTNLGLERALEKIGVKLARVAVGDRNVSAKVAADGLALGGEPSGHVILPRRGQLRVDGLLTALELLGVMVRSGRHLGKLLEGYVAVPQLLLSVPVRERPPLESVPAIREALEGAKAAVGGAGRIVARYSGTEPVARVMLEGESRSVLETWAARLVTAIRETIGA
ncbi:MAG: phosphoglucosamine mutase [Planctomycetales bacterium]|nr:phosphoglucosamine mutase [Planctomycetales bacterium]